LGGVRVGVCPVAPTLFSVWGGVGWGGGDKGWRNILVILHNCRSLCLMFMLTTSRGPNI